MNAIKLAYQEGGTVMEPVIEHGSLVVGDVLRQNQALIMSLNKGELKERPSVGVGLSDMLLDHDPLYWRSQIKEQLEMDGQTVERVRIKENGIEIEADY